MTREPIEVTRQDRIHCLKASSNYHSEVCETCNFYPNCDHMTQDDMAELTIKDLEALEQAPCEDAISRQAVQIELKKCEVIDVHDENDNLVGYYNTDTVDSIVRNLFPVNPQPKTGHWINIDATHSKCDRCGAVFEIASENGEVNYCPNCGCRMIDPQERSDKE